MIKKKKKFINLTGHEVVYDPDGARIVFPPAKPTDILRIQKTSSIVGEVSGCNVFLPNEEIYERIPDEVEDTIFIVSGKVANLAASLYPDRYDLVYPADIVHGKRTIAVRDKITGKNLRHSNGDVVEKEVQTVIGCNKFELGRRR
jgi:hypothetical protein